MSKRGPRQPTGKTTHPPSALNLVCAEGVDVGELLLAELKDRRVRLQKLLNLVWQEAGRLPARRTLLRHGARCGTAHFKRTA